MNRIGIIIEQNMENDDYALSHKNNVIEIMMNYYDNCSFCSERMTVTLHIVQ